jgi:hypothetical protein
MSPRGFYSKELITPYFTSSEYKKTEQYKHEIELIARISNKISSLTIAKIFRYLALKMFRSFGKK